jgi:hypothetical protein
MWMYDLAREQSPTLDHLRRFCDVSLESGYNALGLYLEHRFAYPSTPWSHGQGCVTPEMIQKLQAEFPTLQIIPFLNLLGHMEGLIYTEQGRKYAESRFEGMQACPSNPATQELALGIIEDTLGIFSSPIIHLGGDETWQLGQCPTCAGRELPKSEGEDGPSDRKAAIYGEYFKPLLELVVSADRRPALWGDMLLDHAEALRIIPKQTLIFDWQYFQSSARSTRRLKEAKFDVVTCPSLQTYNATWLHIAQSASNVLQHASEATALGAYGICVTTWECGLLGNYDTIAPAIRASGKMLLEAQAPDAEDDTAALMAIADGKELVIDMKGELEGLDPEEDDSGPSPTVGAAKTLILQSLKDKARFVRIEPSREELHIYYDDPEGSYHAGAMPLEQGDHMVARLRLLSGMRVSGRHVAQEGTLTGSHLGKPFEFRCRTRPHGTGVTFLMARPELPHAPVYDGLDEFLSCYEAVSPDYRRWAEIMGVELQKLGGVFAHSGHRSLLKCSLLLYGNPFLAWLHHADELVGEVGSRALQIADEATSRAPDANARGVAQFLKGAVEFVRFAEEAHKGYAAGLPGVAIASLTPTRQVFENLEKVALATHLNAGGSLADIERCKVARTHVETVMLRIKAYGDGKLGYLPSFETITHPNFMPHDQAAWWRINKWGNE